MSLPRRLPLCSPPMPRRPENLHERYHAHVYFDASTEDQARALCVDAWRECHVGLGRFHRRPVGPHPRWSCQLTFDADEFDRLIPWLDAHRGEPRRPGAPAHRRRAGGAHVAGRVAGERDPAVGRCLQARSGRSPDAPLPPMDADCQPKPRHAGHRHHLHAAHDRTVLQRDGCLLCRRELRAARPGGRRRTGAAAAVAHRGGRRGGAEHRRAHPQRRRRCASRSLRYARRGGLGGHGPARRPRRDRTAEAGPWAGRFRCSASAAARRSSTWLTAAACTRTCSGGAIPIPRARKRSTRSSPTATTWKWRPAANSRASWAPDRAR